METLHNITCMKCKQVKEKLYSVQAFIAMPYKAENQINQMKYTYDLNQRKTVVYAVCEECAIKEVKVSRVVNKILALLYSLILLIYPVFYVLDVGFKLFDSGVQSPVIPVISFLIWCGIVAFIFRKPNADKHLKDALNRLVFQRVNKEWSSGRLFPEFVSLRNRAQIWTEYSIVRKKFRNLTSR